MDWEEGSEAEGCRIPMGRMGGGGVVGVIIAIVLYFLVIQGGGGGVRRTGTQQRLSAGAQTGTGQGSVPQSPNEDNEVKFVSFVLDDAQTFWQQQFAAAGKQYKPAKLVLFRGADEFGLRRRELGDRPLLLPARPEGLHRPRRSSTSSTGRFNAPGDFAQAYVLTHEIGHHVQNCSGSRGRCAAEPAEPRRRQRALRTPRAAGRLPRRRLGSLHPRPRHPRERRPQEGLTAAASVGDDRIQQQAGGRIDPETFTHGTSEQRAHWLQTRLRLREAGVLRHVLRRHLAAPAD